MAKTPLILVVDDEPHIVHVLSVKLQQAGLHVICAMNGRAAMDLIRQDVPDLVITDYQMPKVNGRELCEALLNNESTRDVPVIMLTARSHTQRGGGSQPENIRSMIGKPFSPREVLRTVWELLDVTPGSEVAKAS